MRAGQNANDLSKSDEGSRAERCRRSIIYADKPDSAAAGVTPDNIAQVLLYLAGVCVSGTDFPLTLRLRARPTLSMLTKPPLSMPRRRRSSAVPRNIVAVQLTPYPAPFRPSQSRGRTPAPRHWPARRRSAAGSLPSPSISASPKDSKPHGPHRFWRAPFSHIGRRSADGFPRRDAPADRAPRHHLRRLRRAEPLQHALAFIFSHEFISELEVWIARPTIIGADLKQILELQSAASKSAALLKSTPPCKIPARLFEPTVRRSKRACPVKPTPTRYRDKAAILPAAALGP